MIPRLLPAVLAAAAAAQIACAMPLSGDSARAHTTAKLECSSCHIDGLNKPAPAKACTGCHGSYRAVAALTANLNPNPHDSHMGEIRCTICHAAHKPSQVYCNQCHTFKSLKFK